MTIGIHKHRMPPAGGLKPVDVWGGLARRCDSGSLFSRSVPDRVITRRLIALQRPAQAEDLSQP